MTEKHHPASSRKARKQVERGQRREQKVKLDPGDKRRQLRTFKEATGFARGARVVKR